MKMLRYIRYSRKSSEAKEKQALSIRDQNSECDTIIIREDLNIIAKLEESKTAFKPHVREQFDRMIGLLQSNKADAILTWKPDRLCRNPEEGGKLLQMLQDGQIKEIRTATGDIYTQESDHLILQIHFGIANQFSRNLSKDVKRGLKEKVHDRKEYPRPAIIGYEGIGERGQRNIAPHPVDSFHIQKAFQLASTGLYSLREISETLNKDGLRTKNGKKIGKSHLYSILTKPTYYGFFYHNGELCEGKFEPLVSKGLFDLVQEKLNDRTRPKKAIWDKEFLGLIKCGWCGCSITTSYKNKSIKKLNKEKLFIYHHCTHRRGGCNEMPVTDKTLKDMLYGMIGSIVIDKEVWQLGLKLVKAKNAEQMRKIQRQYQYISQQQVRIREQISRLIEMRSNGELTKEEFIEQKERLSGNLADMDNKANDNSHSVKTWLELMEEFLNTAFQALDVAKGPDFLQKQKVLNRIGENFILKDRKLVITYRKPYDILLNPAYRTNVLGDMDSNHDTQIQSLRSYH